MITIVSILNATIFIVIAFLHIYWAAGGQWGINAAIPDAFIDTFHTTRPLIMKGATLAVALGLLGFALTMVLNYSVFGLEIGERLIKNTTLLIGLVFLARAIGDFNYCGLFRKIKEGLFAESDRRIYTPLCVYLGLSCLLLAFNY